MSTNYTESAPKAISMWEGIAIEGFIEKISQLDC